jgi:hypothetical protein
MKRITAVSIGFCLLVAAITASAQNWATVTAANITDLNQNKLAAGQLCFLATDQNDSPISFAVGGGGQALKRAFCSPVAAGAVTAFTVPNPANTQPAGVYYRVTVKDSSTGQEVLRYSQVTFSGTAFNFDNYAPTLVGSFAPLSGNSVSGNLSVSGNVSVTGASTAASYSTTGTSASALVSTKRIVPNQGSAVVAGDFNISAAQSCNGITSGSWGSTSIVVLVLGTDSAGLIQVSASGTGQSANPCIKMTYHDGSFGTGSIPQFSRSDVSAPQNVLLVCTTGPTQAACVFTGTPVAGNTYQFNWSIVGR